ncbi:MAG: 2-C-methyl-D-erythritol 4-phosphate cytidylyltransferase [Thermodesulfobacteriota bacterium]
MRAAAIIPAAGSGLRLGHPLPKQFLPLAGRPLLAHALAAFAATPAVTEVVVVAPADHCQRTEELVRQGGFAKVSRVVAGGAQRQDSVAAGLAALDPAVELVAVHDGARPLVTPELIGACLAAASQHGAAIAAVPVKDTLKAVAGERIQATVDRSGLWQAQTPQAARRPLLEAAFARAAATGFAATDEAALLEHLGVPVAVVPGSETNLKVTRPEDLLVAEALLQSRQASMIDDLRVGSGFDAHRLVTDRPLVLGGVTIPHSHGLLGHSDADVLTHALMDAILGALGAGDLGRHFPDTDPRFRGIRSILLLEEVMALAHGQGVVLANADVTVIAQAPKLVPHFPAMAAVLAAACQVPAARINLKATTTEGLGFAGRQEGIAAQAVVLLGRRDRAGATF